MPEETTTLILDRSRAMLLLQILEDELKRETNDARRAFASMLRHKIERDFAGELHDS